jgi:hypothetical protein
VRPRRVTIAQFLGLEAWWRPLAEILYGCSQREQKIGDFFIQRAIGTPGPHFWLNPLKKAPQRVRAVGRHHGDILFGV